MLLESIYYLLGFICDQKDYVVSTSQSTCQQLFVPFFPAATAGQQRAFFTVKAGDGVTLPCGNVTEKKHNCDRVTWTFSQPGNRSVSLFERGNFTEEANAKPGRLSVTANCSLVIKNVTMEDVGHYFCRSNRLWKVDLSVVTSEYLHHICI